MFDRRTFVGGSLGMLGCFTAMAVLPFRQSAFAQPAAEDEARFPQGVASGDPVPTGVVLWTRIEPRPGEATIPAHVQVSETPDFARIVVERQVGAPPESDHTVRVVLSGLTPGRHYYYRFIDAGGASSPTGRTRTAPAEDSAAESRFAFASCQNYQTGYYHAYRHLLEREKSGDSKDRIDFVIFLGDFIYELIFPAKMGVPGRPLEFPSKPWNDKNGNFGDHIETQFAETVDEYRYLYRAHLRDPYLRAARQNWPFICIPDDHEVSDDYYQSMALYSVPGTPAQKRKVAGNQAYFEYVPAMLSELPPGQPAHNFRPAEVENAPFGAVDEDNLAVEPNNLKAIGTLDVVRRLRWGQHLDLILTDSRSYRSAHPVPGEIGTKLSFHPRSLLPRTLVEELDAGKTARDGHPRKTVEARGMAFENPRFAAPAGTMYGREQKAWIKDVLRRSQATWKVCVNSVPQLPLSLDFRFEGKSIAPDDVVLTDSWSGYPAERREMLGFIRDRGITNYVSLTGDHHMHFAGLLNAADSSGKERAVGAEFCCAGISSTSFGDVLRSFVEARMKGEDGAKLIAGPDMAGGPRLPWLSLTYLYGHAESLRCVKSFEAGKPEHPRAEARRLKHIRHIDTNSYGIGVVVANAERFDVDLLTFVMAQEATDYAQPVAPAYVAHFSVPAAKPGQSAVLSGPQFSGEAPFPL